MTNTKNITDAQIETLRAEAAATGPLDTLDHATLAHLCAWLDYATDETDRGAVQAEIAAGLAAYPDAIADGLDWREIARRGRD